MIIEFFTLLFITQVIHSAEELATGFHKKWYLFKMSFKTFLFFEIFFNLFWFTVLLVKEFPFRENLMLFFMALMFANGVQHVVWAGWAKKYVPGLVTAPIHIILFLAFYFQFFKQ